MGRLSFIFLLLVFGCAERNHYQCDYFGLIAPTDSLEVFAPNIISSSNQEHSSLTISPDGKEMWWSIWELPPYEGRIQLIKYIVNENGKWSEVQPAPFASKAGEGSPVISPDGNKMFFYSRRPIPPDTLRKDNDIWYVERTGKRWSDPKNLKAINSPAVEATPWITANGNIYFVSTRIEYEDPTGDNDLYYSEFVNGEYAEPVSLGSAINTSFAREIFPYVAPDESYIIFSRDSRRFNDGKLVDGHRKLMISFKDAQGEWKDAIEMGDQFYNARFPSVSPDGRYFFCSKYTDNNSEDIFWMSADFIEELNK